MKIIIYKLIILFLLGLTCNSVCAQTISGPTEICPGNIFTTSYTLNHTCDLIDSVDWQLDYPVGILYAGTNPVYITWSTTSGDDDATLTVIYNCIDLDDDGNVVSTKKDTAELDITILNIHEPIITSANVVELACNETEFTVNVTAQPGSETYSVTHPDCFNYTYNASSSQFNFTTDNAASGEVCITVYQPTCGTSRTECITITRECEDDLTFSSTSPIANSYNSVNNYITASDVSTASFSNLEFKAGKAILLQPGFFANEVFLAHIGPCSCVPNGETGCFYGRAPQSTSGGNITRGNARRGKVNEKDATKQKTELASTLGATNSTFTVYPNPSQGRFTIHFEEQSPNTTIQIFDIMGKLQKSILTNSSIQNIDASELESGVYIIVVSSGEQLFKEKIIISK